MTLLPRHKILLACLLILFSFASLLFWFLLVPASWTSSSRIILIKKGMNLRKISTILEQEGVIRNKEFFIGMVTFLGKKGEIKAGEYEFHSEMLPLEVLGILIKGQVKRHLVTIPEGYTLSQIGQLLEGLNIVGKDAFLQKASSPDFIHSLGLPFSPSKKESQFTLEGLLFPNTYHFIKEMEPEEVIRMMVNQFLKTSGPDLIGRASFLNIDPMDAVILASIIEKESSLPEEKPIISAVLHNRLKKRMPLQSDPTVIYGISHFDGNLTKAHLLTPSPYNTYLFVGLPPTPICNPGKESIRAALYPADVPYFYFVSRNDGTHHFSSDFEEHQRAVAKYQKSQVRKNGLEKK